MSRLLLALTVAVFACKPAKPVRPPEPETKLSPFVNLADELETPAKPLWPTLPTELTGELEKAAGTPADAGARLAGARLRLAGWALELWASRPEAIGAKLRAAYEGVFLAEPLAYAAQGSAEGREAAGLLHQLYDALDTSGYREWVKSAPNVGLDRRLLEILAESAAVQRTHLAAQILTAAEPAAAVDGVLRSLAERARTANDAAKARTLFLQLVERRGANATLDDWIDLSAAHGRVDDLTNATAALAQARTKPVPDRLGQAKLREATKDLATLERYLALKTNPAIEAKIEQLDLLRKLGRTVEAQTLLTQLKQLAGNDARVRVRSAAIGFDGLAQAGNMLEAAGYVADELRDANLVNKDGDYWSMLIGAQGAHAMGEALPELFRDRVAGGKKMVEILKAMRVLAQELESTRPGRAAALELVLDRVTPIVEKSTGQDVGVAAALRDNLDGAVALRAKYPDSIDLDRLVLTFATFAPNRQKALEAVLQRPGTKPEDDIELYLARARTAVTLAIVIATPPAIAAARTAIDDIAPSWSPQVEATREALYGDADALQASITKDAALWTAAAKHYEAARTMHKEVRARVTNNLGWIALQRGEAEKADALFRESGEEEGSDRRWLAFLNALATPQRANERLAGLRSLILSNAGDGKAPSTLLVWLAATSPDPKEAGDAAAKVFEDRADPFSAIKPVQGALGFETEGAFQVGLGLSSRKFYELNTQAYASLWLMPPLPLDDAQLAAKAKVVAPSKPGQAKPPKQGAAKPKK